MRAPAARPLLTLVLPCLTFVLLFSLTYSLSTRTLLIAKSHKAEEFDYRVQELLSRIDRRMNEYKDLLISTQGLFRFMFPTRRQFADYVAHLALEDRYPGIQGVGFSLLIEPQNLESHVAKIQKEGFPTYQIRPEGVRKEYSSIIYLEPFRDRNLRAFGYDMYSEPVRRAAMNDSAQTGKPALSGKVTLVQENQERVQAGFLMYLPVFRPSNELLGWVYAPFRTDDLMAGILGQSIADISIRIFDSEITSPEHLLHDSLALDPRSASSAHAPLYNSKKNIRVAGRTWTIEASSLPTFESQLDEKPARYMMWAGGALSLALALFLWQLLTGRARALAMVDEKTQELKNNQALSNWIHEIDVTLASSDNYSETIGQILERMTNNQNWCLAIYWRGKADTQELRTSIASQPKTSSSEDFLSHCQSNPLKAGDSQPEFAFTKRTAVQAAGISTMAKDSRFPAIKQCSLLSCLSLPIQTRDRVLGVIELWSQLHVEPSEDLKIELTAVGMRIGQKLHALKLQEDLKIERTRLEQLMNAINASAIVSITDKKGNITAINDKFCEISGFTRDELIGQNHRIITSGLESKTLFKEMWQTISRGETWAGEIRNRRKSGEIYTVGSVITPITNSEGRIESYLSVRFDLTSHKKTQQQLEEAQAIAKIGSWQFDVHTGAQHWSPEHYRIFEISDPQPPDQLYSLYRSRIHPDDIPVLDRLIERALTYGEDYVYNHRVILDGGWRQKFVRGIGKVVKDHHGTPKSLSGTCQDLTEVVELQEQNKLILESMGIGIWKLNPVTNELDWDQSMYNLYELNPKDFNGHYQAWESSLSLEAKQKAVEELNLALSGKRPFDTTFEIITPAGARKFIGGRGIVLRNAKSEAIMMYGVNWDKTNEVRSLNELERNKLLLESVLNNIPNMVFVKDFKQELRFTLLNRAGESLLGVKQSDVIGKNDFDFFPKQQAEFFVEKDKEVFQKKSVVQIAVEPIQTPHGLRQLRTYKVPTFDEQGQPHVLIGISTDITEELSLHQQVEAERAKALQTAKLASLGEMSAGIAHEINNPLAIIHGGLRSLKRHRENPEKFDEKLDRLFKSVERISKIVTGLKKFARQSDHDVRELIPLAQILNEVAILTQPKSRRHMVPVQWEIQTSSSINCDAVEIEQVFINIVNNAIEAVKMASARWVKIKAFDVNGEAIVQVTDSGTELSAETERKIFHPFFTTKPIGEGTGLGLSIAKGILDQHQATIAINRQFATTCFEVRFKITSEVKDAA